MGVLKKGKATLRDVVDGVSRDVVLTDVYFELKLVPHLISYCRLMARGFALKERGGGERYRHDLLLGLVE